MLGNKSVCVAQSIDRSFEQPFAMCIWVNVIMENISERLATTRGSEW